MHTTIEILTSNRLGAVKHGFFTRKGGASSGLFQGLNCGRGSSDQGEIVEINRHRVADAMGVAVADLLTVHQVHSPDVVTVTAADEALELAARRADAMVTNVPGRALAVLTADCQPILFSDSRAGVIGAAHAGWKGALNGVIEATIAAMEDLGARHIHAVIGPTISQRAYEVGEEFMDQFLIEDADYSRFFAGGPNGRPMFDLPAFGLMHLREAGVDAEWIGHCTYSDPERFFSYRRATHENAVDYGRMMSVIVL